MRVAYLVSRYPAPSHTFIRREVDALRRRGVIIDTFGLRPPTPDERPSEVDRREFASTWYVRSFVEAIVLAMELRRRGTAV